MAGLVVDLVVHAERPLIDIIQVHGWVYATLGVLAALVYRNRDAWMASLDRRFFRERYDAHQILRQVVDDVRAAAGLDTVASVVVSRMSAAFHSTFCALLVCEPHQRRFHVLAVAPDTTHVPRLTRDSKLVGLVRVSESRSITPARQVCSTTNCRPKTQWLLARLGSIWSRQS